MEPWYGCVIWQTLHPCVLQCISQNESGYHLLSILPLVVFFSSVLSFRPVITMFRSSQRSCLTSISLSFMRSKLIMGFNWDMVSSPRASICPSFPLPSLSASATGCIPVHPPSFISQFHRMNASDCHFWTQKGSWVGNKMHVIILVFFLLSWMMIAMPDGMERPAVLMGGRKQGFKWTISTCSHTPF